MIVDANCRCGCTMPDDVAKNVALAASALATIRVTIPSIKVTSWYRCKARNKAIGGAAKSLHLSGLAFDLNAEGMTGRQIADRLEQLIATGAIPEGGVGTYPGMRRLCHYDARTVLGMRRARW